MTEPTRREAFIGLVAPIGVDIDSVVRALEEALRTIGYKANPIRLTQAIDEHKLRYDTEYADEFQRYEKYIAAGDKICQDAGRNDFFALYGIGLLNSQFPERQKQLPSEVVHIFRQLKRTEEIEALRSVFGTNLIVIACHARRSVRVAQLGRKILSSTRGLSRSELDSKALQIIAIDENERDNEYGQRVVECFQHADFVIDCTNHTTLNDSAHRLVETFFGSDFVSPSVDEYCSYVAKSASLRSTDLSRQVGAAIFGSHCEIIALGCNEVPKAGGGTYWANQDDDHRDFRIGIDSNLKVKRDMLRDLLTHLQDADWLAPEIKSMKPNEIVDAALSDSEDRRGPLANAMINDVIEYGRMLHAEMNAITDAARFRRSTVGATLYCTTMPCHLCSKLIIASGINRVVYIEPYHKSLVEELYSDSVSLNDETPGKVQFEQLRGVTPLGFKTVFSKGKRKNKDGTARTWDRSKAEPIFKSDIPYYAQIEPVFVERLRVALAQIAATPPEFNLTP